MLLVVLGHSVGDIYDPLNKFILSFHMPVFFFISGLVINTRDKEGKLHRLETFLAKKIKSLLVPQMTLFLINISFDLFVARKPLTLTLFIKDLFLWFLVVLFYANIIFWIMDKIGILKYRYISCAIVFILAILSDVSKIKTSIHIETTAMALFFILLGYYMRSIFQKERQNMNCWFDSLWILLIPFIVVFSSWNSPVTMNTNTYGILPLFFACSFMGIWISCKFAFALQNNYILRWFGVNSLIIYIVHPKLLNILHGIGNRLFPILVGKNYLYPVYWHYFILCILLLFPLVYVFNKWFPFLFGLTSIRKSGKS